MQRRGDAGRRLTSIDQTTKSRAPRLGGTSATVEALNLTAMDGRAVYAPITKRHE